MKIMKLIEEHRKAHGEPPKEMLAVYDYIHKKHIEKTEKAERYRGTK